VFCETLKKLFFKYIWTDEVIKVCMVRKKTHAKHYLPITKVISHHYLILIKRQKKKVIKIFHNINH